MSERIVIDPITRIEGHLRVEAAIENGKIKDAYSSGTMVRGIENIVRDRDPRDAWVFVGRVCGVCTSIHSLCSVRAVENALGISVPPNAEMVRNIMEAVLYMHDHTVHFYQLHALDWVDHCFRPQGRPESGRPPRPAAVAVAQKHGRLFHRNAKQAQEVRRQRSTGHLRQRVLGAPRPTN